MTKQEKLLLYLEVAAWAPQPLLRLIHFLVPSLTWGSKFFSNIFYGSFLICPIIAGASMVWAIVQLFKGVDTKFVSMVVIVGNVFYYFLADVPGAISVYLSYLGLAQ